MPAARCFPSRPSCDAFSAHGGRQRPWAFFILEHLLEARAASAFPTNAAGPDEDVNVYLAHLLGRLLTSDCSPDVRPSGQPMFVPPPKIGPRARASYYRANADHRLLYLGVFGRGDGLRRRRIPYGLSRDESLARDMAAGQACYAAAVSHARPRCASDRALVDIWRKLAGNFADYVQVLAAVATRRLGLGAKLGIGELARLLPTEAETDTLAVADLIQAPPPPASVDALLDLWLARRGDPDRRTDVRLRAMAESLGVGLPGGSPPPAPSLVAETDDLRK